MFIWRLRLVYFFYLSSTNRLLHLRLQHKLKIEIVVGQVWCLMFFTSAVSNYRNEYFQMRIERKNWNQRQTVGIFKCKPNQFLQTTFNVHLITTLQKSVYFSTTLVKFAMNRYWSIIFSFNDEKSILLGCTRD